MSLNTAPVHYGGAEPLGRLEFKHCSFTLWWGRRITFFDTMSCSLECSLLHLISNHLPLCVLGNHKVFGQSLLSPTGSILNTRIDSLAIKHESRWRKPKQEIDQSNIFSLSISLTFSRLLFMRVYI